MAAAAPPTAASSTETTNYARLCRLLVDVGSHALRDAFDAIHPPATLRTVLAGHHATLLSLRKKRILNSTQWGNLYPTIRSSVTSAQFDITLLMVLLRNICGFTPPTTGWDSLPSAIDLTCEADIVRIKYFRNTVYGHANQASVDNATFNGYWQEIRDTLVRLGGVGYRSAIDDLETECMDPDTEEHYRELLKQWKKDEDNIKDKLEEIETKVQQLDEKMDDLKASMVIPEKPKHSEDVFDPTRLIERIRQLYKTREGRLSPFHWCEDFHFQLNDIYTRLKMVGKEKTRHTVTEQITNVTGIFRAHEECKKPRTVLIEAEPGMWKSVFCQKLAYDWATEQVTDASFPQIEVLLLLRCHEITTNIWEAIDDQILPRDVGEGEKQSFFNFIRANQSKVLLVLDGLDEVPSSKLPMFSDLFESRELPACHIVVTARKEVGIKVRKYSDSLLEIVGFTEEDSRCFIRKYFQNMEDLVEKLSDKLKTDTRLKDMTANPLNTALLCLLCEDFKGDFPKSRTLLYIEIVRCILRRFRKKKGLPPSGEDLIDVYKEQLKHLGLVALNGLRNNKFFFDEDEVGGKASDIPDLGFLSVQTGSSKRRPRRCYGFPHKSFQEFFAGFYLSRGICDGEIEVESLMADRKYFGELEQVLLFTVGVTASQIEKKAVCVFKSIAKQVNLLSAMRNQGKKSLVVLALKCIEECKTEESELPKHLACILGSELELNSLDLSHVFENSLVESLSAALKVNTTVTRLDLSFNNIGGRAGAVELLSEALKVNTTVTRLDLPYNDIGDCAGAVESLSAALKVNTTVTHLVLSRNHIGISPGDVQSLSEALKVNTTLTALDLSENSIGKWSGDVQSLSEALKVNITLTDLDLTFNVFGRGWFEWAGDAKALWEAVKVNITLTKLDLSDNNLGRSASNVKSLSEALKVNTSLTCLILNYSNIGGCAGAVKSLLEALKVNTTLTALDLSENNIVKWDGDVESILEALKVNINLTDLDLSYNDIGDHAGAVELLSEALKVNTTLTVLNLSSNLIGVSAGHVQSLSAALKVNTTVTRLVLSGNHIGISPGDVQSLSEALKVNTTLTALDLSENYIQFGEWADDFESMMEAFKGNINLTDLDLSCNNIGGCAGNVQSLSAALKVNTTLTGLNLSSNLIGVSAGNVQSLAAALKVNTTVTRLGLSGNHIGEWAGDFEAMVEALKLNTTLTDLDLSWNDIGVCAGDVQSLSDALVVNTTLTALNLYENNIGGCAGDVLSLSEALKVNTTLTGLKLNRINIGGCAGAVEFPLEAPIVF